MPTKKRRVGFIPRSNVLDLINKLSYESNLSNSKIINILVEEALYKRGMFDIKTGKIYNPEYNNIDSDFSKLCMSMQKETLAGENREKYYKKVLNNIQIKTHISMREDGGENIENVICQE